MEKTSLYLFVPDSLVTEENKNFFHFFSEKVFLLYFYYSWSNLFLFWETAMHILALALKFYLFFIFFHIFS